MSGQILIGWVMIAVTVVVHAIGLVGLIALLKRQQVSVGQRPVLPRIMWMLIVAIVGIFLIHTIEIWLWAALYIVLGQFDEMQRALYFSTVTFTTLGYGDITLSDRWQLLSSLEAANGIILFGVSTAFAFAAMRRAFEMADVLAPEKAPTE